MHQLYHVIKRFCFALSYWIFLENKQKTEDKCQNDLVENEFTEKNWKVKNKFGDKYCIKWVLNYTKNWDFPGGWKKKVYLE